MNNPEYTVQRIKVNTSNGFYGKVHGSKDAEITLCGQELDYYWYILTDNFDGEITCKKCLEKIG